MALFEKGNKMGNRFTSENQPKKRGRGRLSMLKYIQSMTGKGVNSQSSKEEILKVIQLLFESSTAELEPLLKDPDNPNKPNKDTPIWVLSIISAINADIRYGRTSTVEMLFDRIFGKDMQPVELTGAKGSPLFVPSQMTTEEIEREIAKIEKSRENQ